MFHNQKNFAGRRCATTIAWFAMSVVLSTAPMLSAVPLDAYRGFRFGMSVSQAAEQAGMKATDTVSVYQRPALIQLLDFRPALFHSSDPTDPVSQISLTFYNGELARIAVLYDRYRVDGMTPEDMIEALSATYGTASRPATEIAYHSFSAEAAPVIARWEDSQYSYNLIRLEDRSTFALVLFSKQLDALAQPAIVEGARLEAVDAPAKEEQRLREVAEAARTAQEKSRLASKASFRP